MLSPISETDSNTYETIDSNNQTVRRVNPDEERKLTGTGAYDIEAYTYDNDYYSDDFESDEEDSESNQSIMTAGGSGTTVDTTAS